MLVRSVRQLFGASSFIRRSSSHLLTTAKMSSEYSVNHDRDIGQKTGEFYINIADGGLENRAVLQYEWMENKVINFYHTEVPPVFRGKGIAKILAEKALNYAVEQDAKFIPTCSYIEKYIQEINPKAEYTSRVAK